MTDAAMITRLIWLPMFAIGSVATQAQSSQISATVSFILRSLLTLNVKISTASGARPQSGAIAGGVVGGLAGVAVMGAVGAIAYHMSVKAIPAISHMGIAGAGGGASQGASGAASAAAHTAYAAHAAHAAQAAHAAHAGHAATAGQAGAQGGAQMTQHSAGAASAGHTLGAGAGPYMGDGGASHAIGQGAAQVPIGTDGGSTMSGGQSFMPSSSQGMGSPLAAPSDFGQGMYPDPASSGASAPLQGYSAPSFPPAGPHGGVGLGVASPGYTPTTTSFPSPPLSTPSSGTPFFVPNTPYPESSRLSLFGRSRKSIRDEENQRQQQMMQTSAPWLNSPGSPVSTVPSFPPQPHTIVDNSQLPSYPPQPTSTRIPAPPQTSIEYAGSVIPVSTDRPANLTR